MNINSLDCKKLKDNYMNLISEIIKIDYEIKEFSQSAKSLSYVEKMYSDRILLLKNTATNKRILATQYISNYPHCIDMSTSNKCNCIDCTKVLNKYNILIKEAEAIESTLKKIDQERIYIELLYKGNIKDIETLKDELTKKELELCNIKNLYKAHKCSNIN